MERGLFFFDSKYRPVPQVCVYSNETPRAKSAIFRIVSPLYLCHMGSFLDVSFPVLKTVKGVSYRDKYTNK